MLTFARFAGFIKDTCERRRQLPIDPPADKQQIADKEAVANDPTAANDPLDAVIGLTAANDPLDTVIDPAAANDPLDAVIDPAADNDPLGAVIDLATANYPRHIDSANANDPLAGMDPIVHFVRSSTSKRHHKVKTCPRINNISASYMESSVESEAIKHGRSRCQTPGFCWLAK